MEPQARSSRTVAHQTNSAMHLKRLHCAADAHLQREMRRTDTRLRRLLGHLSVLEALDDLQHLSSSTSDPSSHNAAAASVRGSTTRTDFDSGTPRPDEVPELEEAEDAISESDEERWIDEDEDTFDDDQNDAEHALVRMSSHPVMLFLPERGDECITSTQDLGDAGELRDCVSEGIESARKARPETTPSVIVVEVAAFGG